MKYISKRLPVFFAVLFASAALLFALPSAGAASGFRDVSPWAVEITDSANRSGIIPLEMYTQSYKKPITRLEIAKLAVNLYKACGGGDNADLPGDSEYFSDTYDRDANLARTLGIMNGKGNNMFRPYDGATREEMAKIAVTLKGLLDGTGAPGPGWAPFDDYERISEWASPYAAKAYYDGIMTGRDDGCFHPKDSITVEEAIAVIMRTAKPPQYEKPMITSVGSGIVSSAEPITVTTDSTEGYTLYDAATVSGEYGAVTKLILIGKTSGSDYTIPAQTLSQNDIHSLFTVTENGVFSEPVNIFTDSYTLKAYGEYDSQQGTITLKWNMIPTADIYTLSVTESRYSVGEGIIFPNDTVTYEVSDSGSFSFAAVPNRRYDIEILGGECFEMLSVATPPVYDSELVAVLEEERPHSKEEAERLIVKITVPVWKLKGGEKYASTMTIDVNRRIADKYAAVFDDIFNGAERFPINSLGAYSWRGTGSTSEHCLGTAIDINPNENFCQYSSGSIVGSYWKPWEDPYSITPYGEVVRAFERHGFTWGGDAWYKNGYGTRDYMHFSYMGG